MCRYPAAALPWLTVNGQPSKKRRRGPRGDAQVALLAAYGLLAFAALGRSSYELVAKFDAAPVAYSLSTLAAVIYCIGVWGIWRADRFAIRIARVAVGFELAGVLIVGTLTLVDDTIFPAGTVWSLYGRDYGWLPLMVPFFAMWWLLKQHPED